MKQFKRMILASTLMVGLAGFAVSCKYGDDIDEIRKDIESLRTGQVASVESQLSSLQATVNNLSSASDAIKGSVSSLESKVNSLQSTSAAEIDALKSAIQNLQGKLSSLESSAATKTEVEDLQKKLEALSSALDGVKDDLSKFEGKTDEKFEEIDNELVTINSEIKKINGQLASILDQLETFAKAEDLQNLVDEVKKVNADLQANIQALQEAVAEIEKLKKADELLQTQIDELKKSLENYVTNDQLNATLETYATVKQVAEDIKAVTDALGKFTTEKAIQDAIDAAKAAAVKAAGEACEAAFQTAFDAAVVAAGLVDAEALEAEIAAYDLKIKEYITEAFKTNEGVINEEIATQIGAAVADLQKLISGRLTSVVLIPELYVGGIEAIELNSFAYTEKKVVSTEEKEEWSEVKVSGVAPVYSAGALPTDVRYHVSPAHLTTADIMEPEFVYESAKTRAALNEELLNVIGWDVKDGELVMTVNKASGAVIDNDNPTIKTAAVRVPIAEKNLVEGETNAVVYSDYALIYENTFVPHIAALTDIGSGKPNKGVFEDVDYDVEEGTYYWRHWHFFDKYTGPQGSDNSDGIIANEIVYNESLDLLSMVTGCYTETVKIKGTDRPIAREITKEELSKLGFEFRFAIPTKPNVKGANGSDQQVFAQLDGSIISSKLPNGVTNNKAAVGKTPIVRVELVDTHNDKIVDVRYFAIQWVEKSLTSATYDKTFDYTLRCGGFVGEIDWEEVVNEILAKVGEDGISYNEFISYYSYYRAELDASEDDRDHNGFAYFTRPQDTYDTEFNFVTDVWGQNRHSAAFVWTLTDEQIGKVMDVNGKQIVSSKHLKVTIPANSGNSKIVLNLTVNIKLPVLPAFNGTQSTFWEKPGEVANIYPVVFKSPTATQYVRYEYDFDRLFADNQIVKNMLPCGKWDMQFAPIQDVLGSYNDVNYTYQSTINPTSNISKDVTTPNNGYILKAVKANGLSLVPAGDAANFTFENFTDNGYNGATASYDGRNISNGAWYSAETAPKKDGVADKAANHKSIKANITLKVTEEDGNPKVGTDWGKSILTMSNERGSYVDDKLFAVNVWAAVNDYNPYLVKTFHIRFIAPFYVNTKAAGKFTDMVVSGSEVEVNKLLTMTDFNGYSVANTPDNTAANAKEKEKYTKSLWDYYVVEDPKWNLDDAMTNLAKVGDNYVADADMEAEDATISAKTRFGEGALDFPKKADGTYDYTKIVFKNVSGVPIESDVQIFIPVTVNHKWGTFTQYVSATLQPRQ